jgi:hypothetical protein
MYRPSYAPMYPILCSDKEIALQNSRNSSRLYHPHVATFLPLTGSLEVDQRITLLGGWLLSFRPSFDFAAARISEPSNL